MDKVKKYVFDERAGYEIHLESGEVVRCGILRSKGTRQRPEDGEHYNHVLRYSDGTVEKAVLSSEESVSPDYSPLAGRVHF